MAISPRPTATPSALVPLETPEDSCTLQATVWPRALASATQAVVSSGVLVWT